MEECREFWKTCFGKCQHTVGKHCSSVLNLTHKPDILLCTSMTYSPLALLTKYNHLLPLRNHPLPPQKIKSSPKQQSLPAPPPSPPSLPPSVSPRPPIYQPPLLTACLASQMLLLFLRGFPWEGDRRKCRNNRSGKK